MVESTNQQINTFTGGMDLDTANAYLKPDVYREAYNLRVTTDTNSNTGVLHNIEGVKFDISFVLSTVGIGSDKWNIVWTGTIRDYGVIIAKTNISSQDPKKGRVGVFRFKHSESQVGHPAVRLFCSNVDTVSLGNNPSCVTRYEDDTNIKLYVADGINPIRVWNIAPAQDSFNQGLTTDASLSIYPSVTFDRPEFLGFGKGVLASGTYQFGYQLFNKNGSETEVSPLTGLIYVNDGSLSPSSSVQVTGTLKGKGTNKSIKLKINVPDNVNYTRIKIVSIFWEDRNELPHIQVLQDTKIPSTGIAYYDAINNKGIADLSLEEFNLITNIHFAPKLLESKNNYLFSSNIKYLDNSLNVDFDARAYRFHHTSRKAKDSNVCVLNTANDNTLLLTQFSLVDLLYDLPLEHDAINPFNDTSKPQQLYYPEYYENLSEAAKADTTRYKCNSFVEANNNIVGGIGKNITYRFLVGDLEESSKTNNYIVNSDDSTSTSSIVEGMWVSNVTTEGAFINSRFLPLSFATEGTRNYSNPQISYSFKSLQRDEVYRYGIVLYNKYGVTSDVKWIGDIRTPSMSDPGFETFQNGRMVSHTASGQDKHTCELAIRPIGIEFEVKNLPLEVVAYEIVRCERTESDRSILAQGVVGKLGLVKSLPEVSAEYSNKIVPPAILTGSLDYRGYVPESGADYNKDTLLGIYANDYVMFAAPEISYGKKNFENFIKDSTLKYEVKKALFSGITTTVGQTSSKLAFSPKGNFQTSHVLSKYGTPEFTAWRVLYDKAYNIFKLYTQSNIYLEKNYVSIEGVSAKTVGSSSSVSNTLLPYDLTWSDFSTRVEHSEGLDGFNYINWVDEWLDTLSWSVDNTNGQLRPTGPNGRCLVSKSSIMPGVKGIGNVAMPTNGLNASITYAPLTGFNSNAHWSTVLLCNLKRNVTSYGGNTYQSRQFSRYITNGAYKIKSDNSKIDVFDGDTFIGVFDYIKTHYGIVPATESKKDRDCAPIIYYIPVESSINLALTNNEEYHRIKKPHIQLEPSNVNGLYVQTDASYVYNPVYSVQATGKEYLPSNQYDEYGKTVDIRTYHSEPKTNDEVIDSWTKFKPLNYIDVDTRYGGINNIRTFGNELIFWQDHALGKFSVLERTMITDDSNAPLLLGTGGVLSRYDYVATVNGIKEGHHDCDTQSDRVLYWFDQDKQELCAYSQGVEAISKSERVQSYIKRLVVENKDLRKRPFLEFDKLYNEVLCCLSTKDTLVYNEAIGKFTSFYTLIPDYTMIFSKNLFMVKGNSLYYYNSDTINSNFDGTSLPIEFKYVVNNPYGYTKVFDNVEFTGLLNKQNILGVTCSTETMTGDIIMPADITNREYNFRFAVPRLKTSVEYPNRLRGRYLECVFKYNLVAQDTVYIVSNEDEYLNTYDDKYMVANRPSGSSKQVSRQLKYYTITGADAETFELPYVRTTFRVSKS